MVLCYKQGVYESQTPPVRAAGMITIRMRPQTPLASPDTLAPLRFGTMGWSYEDWRGPFYTRDCRTERMLEQYAGVFEEGTVELDTTFYGAPRPATLDGWASQVPENFLFSAKVPRAVTHERRLMGAAESTGDFGALLADRLGPKLGALLFQLPPDFSADERETLERFFDALARDRRATGLPWVVEFREPSWAGTDIGEWLAGRGVLCATTERLDLAAPLRYVRLLGTENSVARFDARQFDRSGELDDWAQRLDDARRAAPDPILVYVRNFYEGHAPATIFELRRRLGLPVPTPPGQQQMSLF
jgi:uncharacterized protein YecE (DUF72 family)